jgi:hypothetical protein
MGFGTLEICDDTEKRAKELIAQDVVVVFR